MKKRKGLILLLVCLMLTGCKKKPDVVDPNQPDNPPVVEENKVRFDLVSENVYNLDSLTFKFAIVKVRIKDDKPIQYQLTDFVTDEEVNLGDVERYMDEMDRLGIALSKQNVSSKIEAKENSAIFTLFVPVYDKYAEEVEITFLKDHVIKVDLTQNLGTVEQLGMGQDEDVIVDNEDYLVSVKSIYDATGESLYQKGERVTYPSTAELYGIQLEVAATGATDVVIEEAEYITDESNTFVALDKSYDGTEKTDNIVGVTIKNTKTGYLLLEVLNPNRENITYKGTLRLKINGQWYNVSVNL